LLNLQVDAKRRLTTEFRAFGPNVLLVPRGSSGSSSGTLRESTIDRVPGNLPGGRVTVSSSLYLIINVSVPQSGKSVNAVVAGLNPLGIVKGSLRSSSAAASNLSEATPSSQDVCVAGAKFAQQLGAQPGTALVLTSSDRRESCRVASIRQTDRKSTRLNSSHSQISYAVFCLKKKITSYHHKPDALHHHDVSRLQTATPHI